MKDEKDDSAVSRWDNVLETIGGHRSIDLGKYYSHTIDYDIKHLGFVFARYKFASKMMDNRKQIDVLELGCSYGLGSSFFVQNGSVNKYVGVDLDSSAIAYATQTFGSDDTVFIEEDFLGRQYFGYNKKHFDAVISIDVIEHIAKAKEDEFLDTVCDNLSNEGFALIGTPNITMKPYASAASDVGHVNWFDQQNLYDLMSKRFSNVFIFGMTDEVLHTGFYPFCCYIFALCTNLKKRDII